MGAPASAQPFSQFEKKNPDTLRALLGTGWLSRVGCTFSVSVQTWMALGMSRAVFSLVMEQMSFKRTVSCSRQGKHHKREKLVREAAGRALPKDI